MTLDDLKSWWKHYSPIIKEAKKRNNLNLLLNYVNVYKSMIKSCREETQNEDELKALKFLERSLEETLLDVSMEKRNATNDAMEERTRSATGESGDVDVETEGDNRGFVERIRERYGRGGVIFGNRQEERVVGGRHSENPTYHSETQIDTTKNNLPTSEIVLDNLDSVIYNIEQFINTDD